MMGRNTKRVPKQRNRMISTRIACFIAVMFCCHICSLFAFPSEPNGEPPNRVAALKAKKDFSAIGIEFELIVDDHRTKGKVKHTTFPVTVFRNDDSVQILHDMILSDKEQKFAPLDIESLKVVGPLARGVYLATLKPAPEYATYNFATPIVGKYTYFLSYDSTSFFHTTSPPMLVDLSKFNSRHYQPSDLSLIFDSEQTWIPMPEISERTFSIVMRTTDLKTKQGNAVSVEPLLIFTFKTADSAIPSEAWISATWTVDGKPFLIPKSACSTKWTFDDWKQDEKGNEYPFKQIEEQQIQNVSMLDMLDESTGWLAKLASGAFAPTTKLYLRQEIKVKNWMPISAEKNLFLGPEDGVAVRHSNTMELYVSGVDKKESDRILRKKAIERGEPPPDGESPCSPP
jgi:hypothetical protein